VEGGGVGYYLVAVLMIVVGTAALLASIMDGALDAKLEITIGLRFCRSMVLLVCFEVSTAEPKLPGYRYIFTEVATSV
jgi:hypothetical protein